MYESCYWHEDRKQGLKVIHRSLSAIQSAWLVANTTVRLACGRGGEQSAACEGNSKCSLNIDLDQVTFIYIYIEECAVGRAVSQGKKTLNILMSDNGMKKVSGQIDKLQNK